MPIWNKEAECASIEARQQLQLERLQAMVERIYARVPFYRKKLDEAGVTPDKIVSLKDIAKIPFTSKYELRETYPYGLLACDKSDLVEIHTSSGTTGTPVVGAYTEADIDLSAVKSDAAAEADKPEAAPAEALDTLIAALKLNLDGKVKDVRATDRLTSSAVCLAVDAGQMSMHLEKLLKAHNQLEQDSPRVLEINPRHPLIKALADKVKSSGREAVQDLSLLLLDQARIVEGEAPADPVDFARRLAGIMEKGLV